MIDYSGLDRTKKEDRETARRLLRLKGLLEPKKKDPKGGHPTRALDRSMLLATWNIRELGNNQKYGRRLQESLYYIAEVLSGFDLIAVQEINEDLTDFKQVMKLLGPDWKYLLTDITLGRQGNGERMAFVYDSRSVTFEGLAGQVIMPPVKEGKAVYRPAEQLARTPLMVGFRCGRFRFNVCSVHILYGKAVRNDARRVKEIELLAKQLRERADSPHATAPNLIVLGDFNIFAREDLTAQKLTEAGFYLPKALGPLVSGDAGRHYDQIAFYSSRYDVQSTDRARAGTVRFFDKVFTDEEEAAYAPLMGAGYLKSKNPTNYYRQWRTFQMSDHRLMWIQLPVDFSRPTLAKLMRGT